MRSFSVIFATLQLVTQKYAMNQQEQNISAFHMAMQLGFSIAIPLVVLALLGRFLDKQLGTSPWLLITGIVLSMVVSSIMVTMKAFQLMKNVSGSTEDKQSEKKKT